MLANVNQQVRAAFDGWRNVVRKNAAIENLAAERMRICDGCEYQKAYTCGLCGCPLKAKSRAVDAKCPDSRW